MLLIIFLIQSVGGLTCGSKNSTELISFYPLVSPGETHTFECIAAQPSHIIVSSRVLKVDTSLTDRSVLIHYVVPTRWQDIASQNGQQIKCSYADSVCSMQVNIDFEPQVSGYFKRLKYVQPGAELRISTPFVANPYPPWNYAIRFIVDNYTSDWHNYTKHIGNITLLKSFVSSSQVVHQIKRNHTVLKEIIESIVVQSAKTVQRHDDLSNLIQTIIIAVIYLIFLLVSEVFYFYHQ
jgi:hypothetical protein